MVATVVVILTIAYTVGFVALLYTDPSARTAYLLLIPYLALGIAILSIGWRLRRSGPPFETKRRR